MFTGAGMMYPYNGFGWWMGGTMIIGIAFLILIGFLLYYWLRPRGTYTRVRDDPLEVAKGRLARGEITVQEYEEIKKRLVG